MDGSTGGFVGSVWIVKIDGGNAAGKLALPESEGSVIGCVERDGDGLTVMGDKNVALVVGDDGTGVAEGEFV